MMTQVKVYTLRPPPDALYQHDQLPSLLETIKSEVYTRVLFHFEDSFYQLPGETHILGALTDDEKFWLSQDCILRFLKSTKWDPTAAIKRIEATLKWRRDRRIYSFPNATGVEAEAKTGKGILLGYDTQGRPSLHLMPSKIHAKDEAAQLEFSIFMLERCIALMPPGVQTLNILMNYEECTKQPVISHTRRLLEVLEIHYPGRLKYVVAANVSIFRRLITKSVLVLTNGPKCKLNPDIFEEGLYRPEEMMKQGWGGAIDFTYEYDKYWPELIRLTDQRQKLWKAKWKQLGGTVGIREWDYKHPETEVIQKEAKVGAFKPKPKTSKAAAHKTAVRKPRSPISSRQSTLYTSGSSSRRYRGSSSGNGALYRSELPWSLSSMAFSGYGSNGGDGGGGYGGDGGGGGYGGDCGGGGDGGGGGGDGGGGGGC